MSDSDEFGGFSATTPIPTRKLPPSINTAGPSRVINKRKAANSPLFIISDDDDIQEVPKGKGGKRITRGATAAGTLNRKRKKDDDSEEEDVQSEHETNKGRNKRGGEENEEESEEQVPPPAAAKMARGSSRKPTSTARSGKGEEPINGTVRAVKARGKTKAKALPIINLDEAGEEDARAEVENIATVINAALQPPKQRNTRKPASRGVDKGADDECARLREQLQQARGHIEELKRHVEELAQVRMTEPELLLGRMEAQHRKEQQGSEALINDLRELLSRKDPLLRMHKNSVFELLTRDEANKETQALRDQVKNYQVAIRERDQIVKDRDEEISGLKASVNDLRYELQVEIERANNLSSKKPPDSVARARRGRVLSQNEDPKMAEVVRFYEDLTNLLVTDIKPQPARYLQLEDWLLTCVYSYRDVVDTRSSAKSLSFKLRLCFEPNANLRGEPKGKNDLAESLQYTPLDLEKETKEFVKSLGFLNNPFTFERDQLALFLRTLHEVVSGDGNDDDPGSEDGNQVIG